MVMEIFLLKMVHLHRLYNIIINTYYITEDHCPQLTARMPTNLHSVKQHCVS